MMRYFVFFLLCYFDFRVFCQNNPNNNSIADDDPYPIFIKLILDIFIFLVLVTILLIIWLYIQNRSLRNPKYESDDLRERVTNDKVEYRKELFEIDPQNLEEKKKILGEGYFGVVTDGLLTSVDSRNQARLVVALKKAHNDPEKQYLLHKEMLIMCEIEKHPNILALVGAITSKSHQIILVMEEAHSDLLKYLRHEHGYIFNDQILRGDNNEKTGKYLTENFEITDNIKVLSTFDLVQFAYQIANGMEHLNKVPCVHRDLALRNVLITHNKTIRIGDFGLTRKHQPMKEFYKKNNDFALPEHRMAPESFADGKHHNRFSEKSDIWSFAITLYELFTLGKNSVDNPETNRLKEGIFFDEPPHCLSEIYEFMKLCWDLNPTRRPAFSVCVWVFENELRRFPNQAFEYATNKLKLELEKQKQLEKWVRRDTN